MSIWIPYKRSTASCKRPTQSLQPATAKEELQPMKDIRYLICTLFTGHPVRRVFFMRYSHEYKLECIELYRQGIWPETPEGIKTTRFRKMI